jgi:iron(III) transport system permease protein
VSSTSLHAERHGRLIEGSRFGRWYSGVNFALSASLALLLYLVALPIGYMLFDSLTAEDGATFQHYLSIFSNPKLLDATWNSIVFSFAVAVGSVLIGGPLAYGVARTSMPAKRLVQATIVISLISPDFLLAMAYVTLAGPNAGYVNVLFRAVTGSTAQTGPLDIFSIGGLMLTALPQGVAFVFIVLTPALRNIDPALLEAARLQGAKSSAVIRQITIPLMRPALLSGALLAFTSSLALYGPPQMLRLNVLTVSIREALVMLDFDAASAISAILVVISIIALVLYRRSIVLGERFRTIGGKAYATGELERGIGVYALGILGMVYTAFALVLPYGGMLAVSLMRNVGAGFTSGNWTLDNYRNVINNPVIVDATRTSLILASVSATIVLLIGFTVAYLLVRVRSRVTWLLDYLSILPIGIPGTALALALIVLYINPPLNALGLYGSVGILLIAYVTRFIPFGVRTNQSVLIQLSPELEEASRVSGASSLRTIWNITVPLMRQPLTYAWILVFIMALPELSASIILKGVYTRTLSTVLLDIWGGNGGLATACAFGIMMFVAVTALLLFAIVIARGSKTIKFET